MAFLAKKNIIIIIVNLLRPEECIFIQFNSIFCFCFFKIPSDYNSQMTRRTGYVAEQFESERLPEPSLYM